MRNGYIKVTAVPRSRIVISDFFGGADYHTDEGVLSFSRASDSYNFDFSSGALKTGYGIETYEGFGDVPLRAVWLYTRSDPDSGARDDRLIAVSAEGELLERSEDGPIALGGYTVTGEPHFINYRLYGSDVVLICSEEDGMLVYDGASEPYKVEGAPSITSLALHCERLFVTVGGEKNAVWFSDDLDPTNWDASLSGGGFIQLLDERGACNRAVDFAGYVYVFRDYGISRITAYADQLEFSVSNLFVASGRIYPGSVCVCGDRIMFLASDGLYAFDGVEAMRVLSGLDGLFGSGENSRAFYLGGKYYLSFARIGNENDDKIGCEAWEHVNDCLLVYEVNRGSYSVARGIDVTDMCRGPGGEAIAVSGDGRAGLITRCGAAFGEPLPKRWRAPLTDLGRGGVKRVREVSLVTSGPITLTLRSDEAEKRIEFAAGKGVQRKRVSFSGRRLGFDIDSAAADAYVVRPAIVVTVRADG